MRSIQPFLNRYLLSHAYPFDVNVYKIEFNQLFGQIFVQSRCWDPIHPHDAGVGMSQAAMDAVSRCRGPVLRPVFRRKRHVTPGMRPLHDLHE